MADEKAAHSIGTALKLQVVISALRRIKGLTLALLMARILADHTNRTIAFDDLATAADLLN